MIRLHRLPLARKIMFRSLRGSIFNASLLLKNEVELISAAEHSQQEKDGVNTTLPLSLDLSIQDQKRRTADTVSIQRYEALQNEYAIVTKKYKLMYEAFHELHEEVIRLRKEREEAWMRKK